jgi:hypothetical protein
MKPGVKSAEEDVFPVGNGLEEGDALSSLFL